MASENKVIVPFKLDKDYKNSILNHCRKEGMTLSGLIRKLLAEYAEKNGIEIVKKGE